jgi:3D (Asp-Asp-Asp) domain-containing protein
MIWSGGAVGRWWRASGCACSGLVAGACGLLSACGSDSATDTAHAGAGRAPTLVPSNTGAAGARDDRGVPLGRFVHTFYWMEFESDYSGSADTDLEGSDCRALARVPQAFAERICVEGSGRLASGALLNLSGECDCGTMCPETGASVCFFPVADLRAPWGYGSKGNPLVPLRSLAIEQSVVPHGTVLYIPEWDGVQIPASPRGIGGFVHDGCFRVDDIGYGVDGRHYDLYAGTSALWMALEQLMPTASSTMVYRDASRCAGEQL